MEVPNIPGHKYEEKSSNFDFYKILTEYNVRYIMRMLSELMNEQSKTEALLILSESCFLRCGGMVRLGKCIYFQGCAEISQSPGDFKTAFH